ncbi:MAG TPA: EamA family transporter [Chitinophagales bacterium]|nr:EamA family transporter [Chitinophagales bacterium]
MKQYQFFPFISMVFAGFTAVIAKAGLKNINGDTGLAIRSSFVFIFAWMIIFSSNNNIKDFSNLTKRDVFILGCSAISTTLSWLFYYRAIKIGAVSEVALIDKASIIITLLLSFIFLNEQLTFKIAFGALLIISGLLVLTVK